MGRETESRSRTETFALARVLAANPEMLRVRPGASLFMTKYMRTFPARRFGENLILHSHLPPITSRAYSRFVSHHLVDKSPGPSHAQIGVTNACPQNCEYCYNKGRAGQPMDTPTILQTIDDLKEAGVAWLGLTGGEPLLNPDLVAIVAHAAPDMAVKIFTTGVGLTPQLAQDLKEAGLFSVAVSLDHWEPARHDACRRYEGAFDAALKAISIFKQVPGLHVSVSSVLTRKMVRNGAAETLIAFLDSLGIDEAWLSELKPTVSDFWSDELVLTEAERQQLAQMQDAHNRSLGRSGRFRRSGRLRQSSGMVINYLGHFEGRENFGCNAGCKMVYVDAFGEVSPCVFLPFSFGNVRERRLADILQDMRERFPGEERCFVNRNYRLLGSDTAVRLPLDRARTIAALEKVQFGPPSVFNRRLYGRRAES